MKSTSPPVNLLVGDFTKVRHSDKKGFLWMLMYYWKHEEKVRTVIINDENYVIFRNEQTNIKRTNKFGESSTAVQYADSEEQIKDLNLKWELTDRPIGVWELL